MIVGRNLNKIFIFKKGVRFHSIVGSGPIRNAAGSAIQQQVESWELNLTGQDESKLQGKRTDWWWTGKSPKELVGSDDGILHSRAQATLDNVTEQEVQKYFDNTWTLTEVLFSGLQGEQAFYQPPYHHLRHPMIFYYGHTATFYTNKLSVAGLIDKGINPYFEDIFEVGVDEMRWDDMSKNAMEWPTVGEVHEYRQQVYQLVNQVIDENISSSNHGGKKVDQSHPLWSLFMAFEHDRIHLETSSVLLRELPIELLRKPEHWPTPHESAFDGKKLTQNPKIHVDYPENEMISVGKEQNVLIGKDNDFPAFGWDNEYGSRNIPTINNFQSSKFMVSNGEYYEFVKDGGYRTKEYWSEDGWEWRKFRNAKWPFFWEQAGPSGKHEYKLRTIFETVDMPWDWPVNVNKHEASAFCSWKSSKDSKLKGLRLITEGEHILLREKPQRPPLKDKSLDPALVYGGESISKRGGVNLNLAYGSETPVNLHPPNSNGFYDVTGNAWEWAEDDFNPLDGFKVHPYYDDFSTPCFDGEHNMILGGSFVSSGDAGANLHCRYHFRPHFLQHSGFRYVLPSTDEKYPGENVATKLSKQQEQQNNDQGVYETQALVNQYLALHFGQLPDVVNETVRDHSERPNGALNFPKRCADYVNEMIPPQGKRNRVLDLGCAVGGSSFELAKHFDSVTGIDFSNAFVQAANEIKNSSSGSITFSVPLEGNLERENIVARLNPAIDTSRINFVQGDACHLPQAEKLGGKFDAILMANLLCRLPNPSLCLNSLNRMVNTGGIVVMVSPFSWLEEFTPQANWLQQDTKQSYEVLDLIMQQNGFKKIHSKDMPLLIREHERKYQYIVSNGATFQKIKKL